MFIGSICTQFVNEKRRQLKCADTGNLIDNYELLSFLVSVEAHFPVCDESGRILTGHLNRQFSYTAL